MRVLCVLALVLALLSALPAHACHSNLLQAQEVYHEAHANHLQAHDGYLEARDAYLGARDAYLAARKRP